MSDDHTASVIDAALALPLHQSLGLRLVRPGDPTAGLEFTVEELTLNPQGVLHGGLVPLILDLTGFLALAPRFEPGAHAVTVSTTSSIIAVARAGDVVRSTARVDRLGRTHAFLSGQLAVGDKIVATGQVVKAVV